MAIKPTPVVMVSSLTKSGADATIKALSLGAVDFVAKSAGAISRIDEIEKDLLQKCRRQLGLAASRLRTGTVSTIRPATLPERVPLPLPAKPVIAEKPLIIEKPAPIAPRTTGISGVDDWIVAIGTSTGGPRALQKY